MKTVFPAVLTIHHFRCGVKEADPICGANVCPKMKWEYNPVDKSKRRVCHCDNPCTSSSCGRMIYIYPEKNLPILV